MEDALVVIDARDNVGVVIKDVKKGQSAVSRSGITIEAMDDIPKNHKVALVEIPAHAPVIKYGERIGVAKETIGAGRWVHTHNLET